MTTARTRAPTVLRATRTRLAALAAALATLAACLPARDARTVSLQLRGNVADASVTIDDRYVGALVYVARRGVRIPPGQHRITVERAGYFPWDKLVETSGAPVLLDVKLEPIPD